MIGSDKPGLGPGPGCWRRWSALGSSRSSWRPSFFGRLATPGARFSLCLPPEASNAKVCAAGPGWLAAPGGAWPLYGAAPGRSRVASVLGVCPRFRFRPRRVRGLRPGARLSGPLSVRHRPGSPAAGHSSRLPLRPPLRWGPPTAAGSIVFLGAGLVLGGPPRSGPGGGRYNDGGPSPNY